LTKDALACDDLLAYRRYAYARSAADDGDWRAAAEAFRASLGADPSDAQGAAARPALLGLGEDRQTPRRTAVAKAATASPFDARQINEQGERSW
jgi:predicted TPR repeat methyltransferase